MGVQTEPPVERHAPEGALCSTIVSAVTTARDVESESLDPLHTAIDSDALNAMFRGRPASVGHVTFTWGDCDVTVYSDRRVTVRPLVGDEDIEA